MIRIGLILISLALVFPVWAETDPSVDPSGDPSVDASTDPTHGAVDPSGTDPVPKRVPSPRRFTAPGKTDLGSGMRQFNRTLKAWNELLDALEDDKNKVTLPDLVTPDYKGYLQRGLYAKLLSIRRAFDFIKKKKKPDPEDADTVLYLQTRLENLELELWYIRQQAQEFGHPKLQAELAKAKKVTDEGLLERVKAFAKREGIEFEKVPKDIVKQLIEQERARIPQTFIEKARLRALEKLEKQMPKISKHWRIQWGKASSGEETYVDQVTGKVMPEWKWNPLTYKDAKTGKIRQLEEPPVYVEDKKTGARRLIDSKTKREVRPVRSPLSGELKFRFAVSQPLEKDALKTATAEFKKPVEARGKINYIEDPAYATRMVRALEFAFRIHD